jgi:SNF2 family DNA or RNA helicase
MVIGNACVAPCGHMQCVPCAVQLATQTKACATCRQSLEMRQWRVLYEYDLLPSQFQNSSTVEQQEQMVKMRSAVSGGLRVVCEPDAAFRNLGSKMALIVTQIHSILEHDPEAKILVYCQWNTLKMKLREVFARAQLECCATLEGSAEMLRETLKRFTGQTAAGQKKVSILLCSLELKAAGLNLQAAQHVMLVHPFYSSSAAQATAWEAQAIGRVLRPGQEKTVHVWRFISLQSIDQEIMVKRNLSAWKDYFHAHH